MNLRCTYCQTPFTLGRMEKLAAIQRMIAEELHHYDALCPHCRRANPVSRERLQIFTPGWQEGLRTLEAEAAQIQKETPAEVVSVTVSPTAEPVLVAKKRHHAKPTVKAPAPTVQATKPAAKAKPAAKPATKAKPIAKPVAAKKSAVKSKPMAKAKTAPKMKKPAAKVKTTPKAKSIPKVKSSLKGTKKPAARKK